VLELFPAPLVAMSRMLQLVRVSFPRPQVIGCRFEAECKEYSIKTLKVQFSVPFLEIKSCSGLIEVYFLQVGLVRTVIITLSHQCGISNLRRAYVGHP
jgi:hypothetical protein